MPQANSAGQNLYCYDYVTTQNRGLRARNTEEFTYDFTPDTSL